MKPIALLTIICLVSACGPNPQKNVTDISAEDVFTFKYDRDVFTTLNISLFRNGEISPNFAIEDFGLYSLSATASYEGSLLTSQVAIPPDDLSESFGIRNSDIGLDKKVRIRVSESIPFTVVQNEEILVYLTLKQDGSTLNSGQAETRLSGFAFTKSNRPLVNNGRIDLTIASTVLSQLILAQGFTPTTSLKSSGLVDLLAALDRLQIDIEGMLSAASSYNVEDLVSGLKLGILTKMKSDPAIRAQVSSLLTALDSTKAATLNIEQILQTTLREEWTNRPAGSSSIFRADSTIVSEIEQTASTTNQENNESGNESSSGSGNDSSNDAGDNSGNGSTPPPSFNLSKTSGLNVAETGTTDTFTVSLSEAPTSDVTVSLSSSSALHASVAPASLTFTSSNWNVPQTVTVTGVNDQLCGASTAFSIITSASSSADSRFDGLVVADVTGTRSESAPSFLVTMDDDDSDGTAEIYVVFAAFEPDDSFSVRMNCQPSANVSLSVTETFDYATLSTNSLTFTSSNWNQNQTVTASPLSGGLFPTSWTVVLGAASSTDASVNGINPADLPGYYDEIY